MSVLSLARVYLFDDRLEHVVAERPSFDAQLISAAADSVRARVAHRALSQLARVEDRLLGMLWLIAERWGHVGPDGVSIDFEGLTHEQLGRLIGARRPTVTMAIGELEAQGALVRRPNRYLLAHDAWPSRMPSNGERPSSDTRATEPQ